MSNGSAPENNVRLQAFDPTTPGEYACQVVSLTGEILLDANVCGEVPGTTLEALKYAMQLECLKKDFACATFTISKSVGLDHGAQVSTFGTTSISCLKLSARIRVRDSASIYDTHLEKALRTGCASIIPAIFQPTSQPWTPRDFYDNVYVPPRDQDPNLPTVADLNCKLLPFQERAVRWMLSRENPVHTEEAACHVDDLPSGFLRCTDGDGRSCFVSRLLGVITSNTNIVKSHTNSVCGGILSEEMGLGKTVEMIALMCLNRQPQSDPRPNSQGELPRVRATLIVTPPAILTQWQNEIRAVAPGLRVYVYNGLRVEAEKANHAELLKNISEHDVILTTFNVLSKEIHYAESCERNLRHEKKYEKRISPLTTVLWWRVVLDEAQMIEGGVNNAAKVAALIPRERAWCVSGTPVKKDFNDIFGLLLFLRYRPYSDLPKVWSRLVLEHRPLFRKIVKELALRHNKDQVKDELHLPSQNRIVITVPFSHIEEQHYSSLFQEMAEDCGLDTNGAPLHEDWDPDSSTVIAKMRNWLTRLRQTCLHPEVGVKNRRALGGRGPLRTVNEVLEVMIEQNQSAQRAEERNLFQSQVRRGQILEHANQPQRALDIWLEVVKEVKELVADSRNQLKTAIQQTKDSAAKAQDTEDVASKTVTQSNRLRNALELEHMCVFFIANGYFQLKEQEMLRQTNIPSSLESDPTKADTAVNAQSQSPNGKSNRVEGNQISVEEGSSLDKDHDNPQTLSSTESLHQKAKSEKYMELERLEETMYERAKLLRKEILSEAQAKADIPTQEIKDSLKSFTQIPIVHTISERGGLEFRPIGEKIKAITILLEEQRQQLEEWRKKTAELLTVPLVDETESELQADAEIVGKEYETSTKQQEECYVYVDALRALVSDRHDTLTGQRNLLVDHEMTRAFKDAREGRGHAPLLLQELLKQRQKLKSSEETDSIRGLLTKLRELKTDLRGAVERHSTRAASETIVINKALFALQNISTEQSKIMLGLDREVELFKNAMNSRLEFYRQLQAISDSVAPYEKNMSDEQRDTLLSSKHTEEGHHRSKIATLKSKGRYLLHLRNEAEDAGDSRMCIICQSSFENGILTSCGHSYCLECLKMWWSTHRTCPACKKHLNRQDFHSITYKPQELTVEEEAGPSRLSTRRVGVADGDKPAGIYSGIRENVLNQIKNVDLDDSFGSKIDTIARHLLWIREHDPGAKSIVFSQYKDFLEVLARAFSRFRIGFASIDQRKGIETFKNDPAIECFFLHAKAHSSGLNLINATHVLLCEPLINTAIELQAIARVHRIGQSQETTVWMYLVEGTVEKSIYDISVQRRMAHMGQFPSADAQQHDTTALESQIDAANTLEMEDTALSELLTKGSGGGEMVPREDLWECLFRQQPSRDGQASEDAAREVARQLGADAAEARTREVE